MELPTIWNEKCLLFVNLWNCSFILRQITSLTTRSFPLDMPETEPRNFWIQSKCFNTEAQPLGNDTVVYSSICTTSDPLKPSSLAVQLLRFCIIRWITINLLPTTLVSIYKVKKRSKSLKCRRSKSLEYSEWVTFFVCLFY